ncbi:MAG TPA: hypothetical protein VFT99_23970, partial [Roseiflexaceae bacterium]|nr:hypothetical protein [Roseiflexaceae bacterium]
STLDQAGREVVFEDKARHLGKKTFRQASQDAKRIAAQSLQRITNTGVPEVIDITVYSEGKKITAERFKRMVERQLEKHGLTDLATVNVRTSEQVSKVANVVKARSSAAMHAIEKIGGSEKAARLLPKLAGVARAGRKIIPGVAAAMMVLGLASTAEAATTGTKAAVKGDTAKAVTNLGSAGADVVEMAPVVGSVVAAGRTGYAVGSLMNELFVDESRAMQHGDVARSLAKTLGASDSVADVAGGVAAAGSAIMQVITWTPLRLL